MSHPTTDDVVTAAINLAPHIRAASEEGEATRRVPPALANAIAAAGLFQLHLPRAMGGPELPPLTAFRVIEELSKVDGAVGWCTMIATALSALTGWLSAEVGRAMCGQPPDLRLAGSFRPQGHAAVVEGGYRVRGHWTFASGIQHATWLYCPCIILEGETPQQTAAGAPVIRTMWVPAASATIEDTWSVVGLCGTGSHDFRVDDVFVPFSYTSALSDPPHEPGPLYHPRLLLVTVWTSTVANALGMARGAIERFIELAACTSSTVSPIPLRDRPLVQTRVAEAEAILSAARAYVIEAVGTAWEAVCTGASDLSHVIAQARLAITHGMHEAVRAIDLVFHAAGTNALYRTNPLERYFRDIHAAVQHNAAFPAHYESAGKVFLGLRPSDMGW